MSCTGAKISNTCGSKSYSVCVYYEGSIPSFSSLTEEECINMQEVAEDLYEIIGTIKEESNLESLRDGCITYPAGTISIVEAFEAQQNKICSLETLIQTMQSTIATMQQQIQDLQENQCP